MENVNVYIFVIAIPTVILVFYMCYRIYSYCRKVEETNYQRVLSEENIMTCSISDSRELYPYVPATCERGILSSFNGGDLSDLDPNLMYDQPLARSALPHIRKNDSDTNEYTSTDYSNDTCNLHEKDIVTKNTVTFQSNQTLYDDGASLDGIIESLNKSTLSIEWDDKDDIDEGYCMDQTQQCEIFNRNMGKTGEKLLKFNITIL